MLLNRKSLFVKSFGIIIALLTILYIFATSVIQPYTDVIARSEITVIDLESNTVKEERKTEGPTRFVYSYADLGVDLCDWRAKRLSWPEKMILRPEKLGECPEGGIVTVVVGGRTGNLMWEYASALALSKVTGLAPFVPKCLKDELDVIFQNLTVPSFQKIAHCPIKTDKYVEALVDWTNNNQSIILPQFHFQKAPVSMYLNLVKKEFTFKPMIKDRANKIISHIVAELPPAKYTFIAVHVRRTDYIKYLKRKYGNKTIDPKFFERAMNYFRKKYPNCLFIFITDDPKWCYARFGSIDDVFVASRKMKNSPAVDLALMAACNHTIYDYGTFGDWGAFLAGGEVVMFNMIDNEWKPDYFENWSLMD